MRCGLHEPGSLGAMHLHTSVWATSQDIKYAAHGLPTIECGLSEGRRRLQPQYQSVCGYQNQVHSYAGVRGSYSSDKLGSRNGNIQVINDFDSFRRI